MRKTFLAICFMLLLNAPAAMAAVTALSNPHEAQLREAAHGPAPKLMEKENVAAEDFGGFLKERIRKIYVSALEDATSSKSSSMDVQQSEDYIAAQKAEKKSTFEKIYDAAISRVSLEDNQRRQDIRSPQNSQENVGKQEQSWQQPTYEVVTVALPPRGEKEVVPAKEHIPYMFSNIEVLPTGLLNITDTIVVVANGEKLKYGLSRAIPKHTVSRLGKKSRIDLSLVSVSVNGQEVPYKLEEDDQNILMVPATRAVLPNGVYTYVFNYVIDRRLWYYDEFNELYWDVTGSSWNLVIGRVGAALTLPNGAEPIGYNVLVGAPGRMRANSVVAEKKDIGSLGLIASRPLYIGEGMHLIASIPKEVFEAPSFGRMISWLASDFGDVIFALFGLGAILLAYLVSWKGMNKKGKQQGGLKRNAVMLRYLTNGVYDKISFGAFLLEVFKKNLIDIQKSDNTVMLVKKSDTLKGMSRLEKKALNDLFINKEAVLAINANNALKIKRAYKAIEMDTKAKFRNFVLMLNFGYLFFSVGMLLLAEVFMAMVKVDTPSVMMVSFSCSLGLAFSIFVFGKVFEHKGAGLLAKACALVLGLWSLFVFSVFINFWAAVIVSITIYIIFSYTKLFGKRSGLMKNNIKEAAEYSDFLLKNKEAVTMGKNFAAQQPNIFALELGDKFLKTETNRDFYRLDLVEEIVNKL